MVRTAVTRTDRLAPPAPAGGGHPDAAARRWLDSRARDGGALGALAVAAGAVQTVAAIALAGLLAGLLHTLIVERGDPFATASGGWGVPLALAVRALAGVAREEAGQRAARRIRARLRTELLDRLHALGPAWRERHSSGGLAALLLEQVEAVDGYFARYRPQQRLAVLAPLLILAAVAPSSWVAAALLLLTAPLIPLFMVLVGWGAQARQARQWLALQRMSGHFLDLLRGLPTLRLLDAHGRQAETVAQVGEAFRQRTMSVLRLAFLSGAVLEFFASVAIALTAVYLGFSLLGYLDFGFYGQAPDLRLAFFVLLLAPEFYQPLRDLGTHYHARAEALAAAGPLHETLVAVSPQPAGGTCLVPPGAPALQLDRVTFAHHAAHHDEPVLRSCSLQVAAGETVAIVGPSGGGKTTLLRLLLGQLSPQAGYLGVAGLAFGTLDLPAWRERVGWMSQHPRLLAATLAANLRVARHDADDAALVEALRFAGLGDWLATLPAGLATALGEGGRPLSGGQLRRLALARVYLRQADVLLLDEPTASLDPDTEAWVVARLAELRRGKTVLICTHRRAPLALAERGWVLVDGGLRLAVGAEEGGTGTGIGPDHARLIDCDGEAWHGRLA